MVCSVRRRRPRCSAPGCTAPSEYQCDAPVGRRTCDRYLCRRHRTPGGVGFCPDHAQHASASLMADKTGIEWTEASWNPIVGCSVISPGCTNCYAMREAGRWLRRTPKFAGLTQPSKAGPVWNGDMRFWEKAIDQPLRWKKPRRIFVNSMSDLFHESLPDEWIDRVFGVVTTPPAKAGGFSGKLSRNRLLQPCTEASQSIAPTRRPIRPWRACRAPSRVCSTPQCQCQKIG